MTNSTRLTDLAMITGRTRESIRNITKARQTPWDEGTFEGSGQRRYDGEHALALVILEQLHEQGLSLRESAEVVFAHRPLVSDFIDEIEGGQRATERFVSCMKVCDEDDRTGTYWFLYPKIGQGSPEEIADAVLRALKRTGEVTPTLNGKAISRRISGPHLATTSIRECYLILRARAFEAGFEINGRDIQKKTAPEPGQ